MFLEIIINSILIMASLILFIRLCGLKSFSKMTSFDFAVTIAIGSILASTVVSKSVKLQHGILAIGSLFLLQYLSSYVRTRNSFFNSLINNTPMVLYRDGKFYDQNLKKCDLRKEDIYAKLREANAINIDNVKAVIFESTGDVSVLHGDKQPDEELFTGVST